MSTPFVDRAMADVDRLAPEAIKAASQMARENGWDGQVIGAPLPAGGRLYSTARSLARPVARGHLPIAQADAALICATLHEERKGGLGPYKAPYIVAGLRHALRLSLDRLNRQREVASDRIAHTVEPMIRQRQPFNALLAEAHGVNGAAQFPLSEPEVTDLVKTEVYWSLPEAPRGRRHVR